MSSTDPTWTARIPPYVKEYLQGKKGLSAGYCLIEYYKILKSQELPDKLKELRKARERVLQLEGEITQLKNESNTQWGVCNTIFDNFNKQPGFDINNLDEKDKYRIKSQLNKKNISIGLEEFIIHYSNNGSD